MTLTRTSRPARRRAALASAALAAVAAVATLASPAAQADDDPNHLTVVYDVVGSTHIGAKVDADMPIGPTTIEVTIDTAAPLPTPIIDGTMTIPSQVINFKLAGLPARARATLTQVGPITGTLTKLPSPRAALDLASSVKYDIRLSDIEVRLGAWLPLGVGSNCHTEQPAAIDVSSPLSDTSPPTGFFTINGGGPATGTYSIGTFTGCAPLNFLDLPDYTGSVGSLAVNAIVPGTDNTLAITLSNPRPPAS